MEFLKIVIALLAFLVSVNSQCLPGAPKSPLCVSETAVTNIKGDCSSQVAELKPRPPCCNLKEMAEDPNACPPTDGSAACRYAELDKPACDIQNAECKKMSLKFSIQTEEKEGTCCETCSCWGDPHCESFNGKNDTWILCDSRVRKYDGCGLSKSVCVTQKDHNGNPCTWIDAKKWNVGLKGSQCVFDMENQDLPEIHMYSFDGFSVDLDLGERGIISQFKMKSGGEEFFLTSENCFADYGVRNAFRSAEGAPFPPLDPTWPANQWLSEKVDGGDVLWAINNLPSNILINIRCTRTAVVQNKKVRYGPPRLNIEQIVEPVKPASRKNPDGFCYTDSISKGLSSVEHTDKIELERTCADASDELQIGKLLCGKGLTRSGVNGCKKKWCQSVRPFAVDACVNDIRSFRWRRTFCAANTLISRKAADCVGSGDCGQCMSDIVDFGWEPAILKWTGKIITSSEACLTADDLPDDLVGCQRGLRIQYEVLPGNWVTYKAIPAGATLCDGSVTFNSETSYVLFGFKVRISQCGASDSCLTDACDPELGFGATFEFIAEDELENNLLELVQSGDLICNPNKGWNSDDECLEFTPPAMCPCR